MELVEEARLRQAAQSTPDLASLGALAQYLSDVGLRTREVQQLFEAALAAPRGPAWHRAFAHYAGCFAVWCESKGQLDKARSLYEQALEANPQCPYALGNYPQLLLLENRPLDDVEAAFENALRAHPGLVSVLLKYAAFLRHKRKSIDRAEDVLLRALEIAPHQADVLSTLAVFLHATRPNDPRIEDLYARSVNADPFAVNTLSNFGLFLAERGDAAEARKRYDQALAVQPDHANSCYNYAVLLESNYGDVGGAVALYERALLARPDHAFTLYNLAVIMEEKRRDYKRAEKLYRAAVDAAPTDSLANADLGRFLVQREASRSRTRSFDEATRFLDTALAIDYNCATAHAALGELALCRGDIDVAKAKLNSALRADAANTAARRLAGLLRGC